MEIKRGKYQEDSERYNERNKGIQMLGSMERKHCESRQKGLWDIKRRSETKDNMVIK